ncbi:MAG: TonB-dependent receptor [Gemmatimonadetes bacterium]|nr:TonB-dependent receptor [Gemmatimonadota bacterium]
MSFCWRCFIYILRSLAVACRAHFKSGAARSCCCTVVAILVGTGVGAQDIPSDYADYSLQELLQTKVKLAARKAETVAASPAAVFLLTRDDIRRLGITSIADALRLVPGFQVARIDGNKWAISARGFNGRFASKLLVQIDGRSVYTPLFSGVYWEAQDVLLEDVERIEVIRGPGATLWGSNAVNGVINVVTRKARETQGGRISAGSGTEERSSGALRYGGRIGDNAYYRLFGKYFKRDALVDSAGNATRDGWDALRGGFRLDWEKTEASNLILLGDFYDSNLSQTISIPRPEEPFFQTSKDDARLSGGSLLGRWERRFSSTSNLALQLYYDYTKRRDLPLREIRNTFDIDFQHHFGLGLKQEIVWGGGYRFMQDDLRDSFYVSFNPDGRKYHQLSGFVQDEVALVEERLRFIAGIKIEHQGFSGFEVQPSTRLIWQLDERHTLWGAFARATSTPSRADNDFRLISGLIPPQSQTEGLDPSFLAIQGNRDLESEKLRAFELGYRFTPVGGIWLDLATFYNTYRDLTDLKQDAPVQEFRPPHIIIPLVMSSVGEGAVYGFELAGRWQIVNRWGLYGTYTYLNLHLEDSRIYLEGVNPSQQASLYSRANLPGGWELDWGLRYVGALADLAVPEYLELDGRLGWRMSERFAVSIGGQNLLADHHAEFRPRFIDTQPAEVERCGYLRMVWHLF